MFELWYAITLSRRCNLSIILAPEDRAAFNERINADGTDAHAIDEALAVVDSERAEAYSESDLDAIRSKIKTLAGGFATLDYTIKQHLRRWFVSQGGVKVVARGFSQTSQDGVKVVARTNHRLVSHQNSSKFGDDTAARTKPAPSTSSAAIVNTIYHQIHEYDQASDQRSGYAVPASLATPSAASTPADADGYTVPAADTAQPNSTHTILQESYV